MRATRWTGGLALAMVALVAAIPALRAAPDEPAQIQAHPRFDDGGTLDWRTRIADAMEVAADRRRLIFIEWGRES